MGQACQLWGDAALFGTGLAATGSVLVLAVFVRFHDWGQAAKVRVRGILGFGLSANLAEFETALRLWFALQPRLSQINTGLFSARRTAMNWPACIITWVPTKPISAL